MSYSQSAVVAAPQPRRNGPQQTEYTPLYTQSTVTRRLVLKISEIGTTMGQILLNKLQMKYEGKCCEDGYIKAGSSRVISYSAGKMNCHGDVEIIVVVECMICNPVAGAVYQCTVTNSNNLGIAATSSAEDPSPIIAYISREFNVGASMEYNIGDPIQVQVVGQRCELNDPAISVVCQVYRGSNSRP